MDKQVCDVEARIVEYQICVVAYASVVSMKSIGVIIREGDE